MPKKFERKKNAIRREIRSLSAKDRDVFFDAMKVMRNTSDVEGRKHFGPQFRSYNYLTVKHAIAAAHSCADQGHLARNQIVFHRALLAEFENSILAIALEIDPQTTLEGLPYWNFVLDFKSYGDVTQSSVWKYWGSPFGDPDDNFCIQDPFFKTTVPTVRSLEPEHLVLLNSVLIGAKQAFANGYGFLRSPWSPNRCPGLSRNPGWAFGRPMPEPTFFKVGTRNCSQSRDFLRFAECVQGSGYGALHTDFGPHNVMHLYMGTFSDNEFGVLLGMPLAFAIAFFIVLVVVMSVLGIRELSRDSLGGNCRWVPAGLISIAILLFHGILLSISSGLSGVDGLYQHVRWSSRLWSISPADFTGKQWRVGDMRCPPVGSCDSIHTIPEDCECSDSQTPFWVHYLPRTTVIGSDFWDGAYSVNENFFYPLHAFVDMLHLAWAEQNIEKNPLAWSNGNFGGVPTSKESGGCPGTALDDVVSEEMCFTQSDIGSLIVAGSSLVQSRKDSATPLLPCLTMRDVFNWSMSGLFLNRTSPYTYDQLDRKSSYFWSTLEPDALCPGSVILCKFPEQALKFNGTVLCNRRNGSIFEIVEDIHCSLVPKPDPPVKICICSFEFLREKAINHRERNAWFLPFPFFVLEVFYSLLLLIALPIGRRIMGFFVSSNSAPYEAVSKEDIPDTPGEPA